MKATIDRIEDGKTAVVVVSNGGTLNVPLKEFGFKVHEGMHLFLNFKPAKNSESRTLKEVLRLQKKLLKRSRKK